jgi:ABC-type sulfate transport system permease component
MYVYIVCVYVYARTIVRAIEPSLCLPALTVSRTDAKVVDTALFHAVRPNVVAGLKLSWSKATSDVNVRFRVTACRLLVSARVSFC